MSNTEAYIIFEADQVLTNDHLNEQFDYLDVQERLTRNKLIGIGIVCGLEVGSESTFIHISKGCGVTSKGYLIVWEDADLTQFVSYTLPSNPLYKPFVNEVTGKQYDLLRLVTDDEAKTIDGTKTPVSPEVLKDKIVVLFLEANELDLKNCDTQDCNEKGRQMQLTVRALLIGMADMEAIIEKQNKLSGHEGLSNSYIERLGLKDIPFKRFDVKATPLADTFDIYNAYLKCLDDVVLQNIADAYSQCYSVFSPVLGDYGGNPFKNLFDDLKNKLAVIKKSLPLYIQYYYDFLDDLIKAYLEFKERSFEVVTECCPDEDLFPMHLMLGEASADTRDFIRSPFRQYFIASPLFNSQADLQREVKLLFDRMVNLTLEKNFFIPQFSTRAGVPIRITPSKWSDAPLSCRAIPYYYNINAVAPSWSPQKTRKGKWNYNLSYNADKYSTAPPLSVTSPFDYSIEPFDFYRIEGHLGQEFSSVLNVILSARNANRLPFDVIAVKAGVNADDTTIHYDCHFEDLEAQFKLIRAELACKMHEPLCIAAKVPSLIRLNLPGSNTFNFLETFSTIHSLALQDVVNQKNLILTNFAQIFRFTRKGDFLKTYCPVNTGTLGGDYIGSINKFFPRPAQVDLTTAAGSKAALMCLIDLTEALMQTITGASTIYNFNYTNFNRIYDSVISFFTDFMQAVLNADGQERKLSPFLYGMLEAVVTCCIDEKLKALTEEYTRRVQKIQQQNLLSQYLVSNPGIDHKAGVPRGGTFILVYHEAPPTPATVKTALNTASSLSAVSTATTLSAEAETSTVKTLAPTSAITKENISSIIKLFEANEVRLSPGQADILQKLTLQNIAAAALKDPFTVADKAVVADFYLPYLCCSDCPPIAYVLPKLPQLFTIDPTTFCSDDEKPYTFKADPKIEDISTIENKNGLKLEQDAAGAVFFIPAKQGIQQTTDYQLVLNGTAVTIKIFPAFQLNFDFGNIDPFTVRFTPVNTANKTVSWNFGDGSASSNEQNPVHKYSLTTNPQTFKVILTATDGPCIVTREQELTLRQPDQLFNLEPREFCSNDAAQYFFTAEPAIQDPAEIENPQGLQIERGADGRFSFAPAKQNIQQSTVYNLTFKGQTISLTIKPIFGIQFSAESVDAAPTSRRFVGVNTENKTVAWNFGDGTPVSTEASPVHNYTLSDNTQTFTVTLTATDGPCSVTTEQMITISQPVPVAFVIEPLVFCSKDRKQKTVTIQPVPNDVGEIKNPGNLQFEKDAAGNVFFVPAKQDIAATQEYDLNYRDIVQHIKIIVPNASFNMDIQQNTTPGGVFPSFLFLKAKQRDADSFTWKVTTVTGRSFDFDTPDVTIDYRQLDIAPGAELSIDLVVGFKNQTNADCRDIKNYVLTDTIFNKHKNAGEFDNLTSA